MLRRNSCTEWRRSSKLPSRTTKQTSRSPPKSISNFLSFSLCLLSFYLPLSSLSVCL